MAITLGGTSARRAGTRIGSRTPVRAGAAGDTAMLALCVLTALVLLFLPGEERDRVAATLRRTAVAPLAQLQREAEIRRAKYLSYDERVRVRGALARDAADVTGLRSENDRLRRMLGLGARLQWGFVAAEAIPGQVAGKLVRQQILETFLLTVGSRAGVTQFAPVVAPEGLVGMVEQVDPAMSVAISYAHPDFRVSVQTPNDSAYGIVQAHLGTGANRGMLELRGVAFRSPLKPGQLLVSSGQGGTYPRGVPVGTVVREIQTVERWARTYLLQPSVNLGDVGAVMVLQKRRAVAGVDSVWTSLSSADSATRRIVAAGDSIARDALVREAAARRAAFDSTRPDSGATRSGAADSTAPGGTAASSGTGLTVPSTPAAPAASGGTLGGTLAPAAPSVGAAPSPAERAARAAGAGAEAAARRPAPRPTVPEPAATTPRPAAPRPTAPPTRDSAAGTVESRPRPAAARPAVDRSPTGRSATSRAVTGRAATGHAATGHTVTNRSATPRTDSARRRPATGAAVPRPTVPAPTRPASRPRPQP